MPGEYAALEAHKALGAGMDVLLFSDGVPIEDEVALKRRAHDLGLLVMGPGAGTAIIDGVALGFANVVARGSVGVVAAAGTGAQEVTVLVDRAGAGVSRCYGTGGRDLKDDVGAITALDAIARLDADDDTDVILCVSKPPSPEVAETVLRALASCDRPTVACMVGGGVAPRSGVHLAATLEEAALEAARLAGHPMDAAAAAPRRLGHPGVRARAVLRRHPLQRGGGDPGRSCSAPSTPTRRRARRGASRATRPATPASTSARRSSPAAARTR